MPGPTSCRWSTRCQARPAPRSGSIGTDGGYLDVPVKIDPAAAANRVLPMMPGERYWVIVDFAGYRAGRARAHGIAYSGNWRAQERRQDPLSRRRRSQGQHRGPRHAVPGERRRRCADGSYNPALRRRTCATPMVRLAGVAPQLTRQLTLNEVMGLPVTAPDPVTGVTIRLPRRPAGGPGQQHQVGRRANPGVGDHQRACG